jgi:PPM family protein phosphatase
MSIDQSADTAVLPAPEPSGGPKIPAPPPEVRAEFGGLSHPGKVRPHNEDHFLVARLGRQLDALLTNLPESDLPPHYGEAGYSMVVADGMGGVAGGELASRLAITALVQAVLNTPDWVLRADDGRAEELLKRGAARMKQAHAALESRAARNVELSGMGTTMTVTYSLSWDLFVGHVGDSRAYLFREGRLRRLTRDHTLAQEMADAGVIAAAQVATHRLRHVLTRSLGGSSVGVSADVRRVALAPGDAVLLCSDGLTGMVPEPDIAGVLARGGPPQEACQALVDLALAAGGKDNVTVVLGRYSAPDAAPAAPG